MLVLPVSEAFCSIPFDQEKSACVHISDGSPLILLGTQPYTVSLMTKARPAILTYTIFFLDVDYKKYLLISARDFVTLQSN